MTDRWVISKEGLTAAKAAAGQVGYVIPEDRMIHILQAAFAHMEQEVAQGEAEMAKNPTPDIVLAVLTNNVNILGRDFYQSGWRGRLRWLFSGKTQ